VQATLPCPTTSNAVMMFHIATTAVTTILVAFLTQRRIRKDKTDAERWRQNEAQHQVVRRELRYGPSADVEDDDAMR